MQYTSRWLLLEFLEYILLEFFHCFFGQICFPATETFFSVLTNLSNLTHSKSSEIPFAKVWSEKYYKKKCSCLQMFFKIGVFINFLAFIIKYMCWRHFLIKLQPWWSAALLKRRPQHRCFPVNIATCLRITFFMEHLRWLLLKMVEEVLRISNSTREIFAQKNL